MEEPELTGEQVEALREQRQKLKEAVAQPSDSSWEWLVQHQLAKNAARAVKKEEPKMPALPAESWTIIKKPHITLPPPVIVESSVVVNEKPRTLVLQDPAKVAKGIEVLAKYVPEFVCEEIASSKLEAKPGSLVRLVVRVPLDDSKPDPRDTLIMELLQAGMKLLQRRTDKAVREYKAIAERATNILFDKAAGQEPGQEVPSSA